jgi:hypothetical protein
VPSPSTPSVPTTPIAPSTAPNPLEVLRVCPNGATLC